MIRVLNRLPDSLGLLCGFPLGLLTGSLSFIRNARMFHPCGILVKGKVTPLSSLEFPEEAILRFSSAWWKYKEWRDVLGVAIRFGEIQDLLFASFKHPWQTPFGPFMTKYHDFFLNDYFAVSPFIVDGKKVYFKLQVEDFLDEEGTREEKLKKNIGRAKIMLMMGRYEEWHPIAEITLLEEIKMNQHELKFNPFLNGLGIYPKGFIQYLRFGSYRFSQFGRMIRHEIKKVPDHIHKRRIIHGL